MKYFYLIVFTLTFLFCKTNSDNYHHDRIKKVDLTNNIIGVWEFVHTTDIQGNKLDSIKMRFGTMKAAGPKLIYHSNKEFIKIFTPVNSDKGYWRYNPENSSIEHDLYIDSTDWTGKSLISNYLRPLQGKII